MMRRLSGVFALGNVCNCVLTVTDQGILGFTDATFDWIMIVRRTGPGGAVITPPQDETQEMGLGGWRR